ncbi:hypothetical protein QO231_09060 [Sedimentitalea todarodis]|uniref:Uncharacterized protein n=2 Tax=Sedimentitalea todarodis TaxID=1631240 RepID=A0ABU3VCW2_9RHOB|nr:hypothetical protein [Sedimentitalea todarodis]
MDETRKENIEMQLLSRILRGEGLINAHAFQKPDIAGISDLVQEMLMIRFAMSLYSLIFASLAGTAVSVVLVAGHVTLAPILIAAATGAVLAVPAAYLVARKL